MSRLTRRFLLILVAIVSTLLIGTVGFTTIEHYPPFDAHGRRLTEPTRLSPGQSVQLGNSALTYLRAPAAAAATRTVRTANRQLIISAPQP